MACSPTDSKIRGMHHVMIIRARHIKIYGFVFLKYARNILFKMEQWPLFLCKLSDFNAE